MADTILVDEIVHAGFNPQLSLKYPIVGELLKHKNKVLSDIQIFEMILTVDTLSGTLAETGKPTNVLADFTTPLALTVVSDAAGDTEKTIYVIGQKSTGEFGKFSILTDDTDGTTTVTTSDLFNLVWEAWTEDTIAGSIVVATTTPTTLFTLTNAAKRQGKAKVYCPDGKKMAVYAKINLTAVAASKGIIAQLKNEFGYADLYNQFSEFTAYYQSQEEMIVLAAYLTAVLTCNIQYILVIY